MVFDLKAATHAAQTEAQRAPFDFEWAGEKFTLRSINEWPVHIQAEFLDINTIEDEDDTTRAPRTMAVMREIVGDENWDRFARTVPLAAIPTLINEMSKQMVGVETPDFSKPSPPGSTPT